MGTQLTWRELGCWNRYLRSVPPPCPVEPRVTASHTGTLDVADELLALYLSGHKTAGSSLVADFVTSGDPLPEVGDFWICLDGEGEPRCILQTVRVEINRFSDVPASIASAEGEGDGSLDHWRRVHTDLYEPDLARWGIERIDDAEVVTEFFTIVFRDPGDR